MTYQALARKWRPKSFATLVGQEHVVKALTHALEQGRLHHAYLLTGTRGVGKTTIARIMAKALNCEQGVSATPCGECSSCREIDGGRFIDYIELDAASNRGLEDMTGLLEKAVYVPTRGRFKVYVIDEVHQLTGHAFNAMLKTLEEPPEHVKFILATTDPQKIPVTVLSRCLQFNLKPMPAPSIIGHIADVLQKESIKFEPGALPWLAKAAAGSMRDALSLLDQAISHGAGELQEANVREMLGTVGDDQLFAIIDGLLAADINAMLQAVRSMHNQSLAADAALQSLAVLFHRIAMAQFAPQALDDDAERDRLAAYASAFDAEFIQLCYQIVIHGRDELELAPDEASGLEMTIIRLFAFRPESFAKQVPQPRSAPAASTPSAGQSQAADQSKQGASAQAVQATPPAPQPSAPESASTPSSARQPKSTAAGASKLPIPSNADDWHTFSEALPINGMVKQLAQNLQWTGSEGNKLIMLLAESQAHLISNQQQIKKLTTAIQTACGQHLELQIELANTQETEITNTPAQRQRQIAGERRQQAVTALEQDPFVQDITQRFGAKIEPESARLN